MDRLNPSVTDFGEFDVLQTDLVNVSRQRLRFGAKISSDRVSPGNPPVGVQAGGVRVPFEVGWVELIAETRSPTAERFHQFVPL